MEKIFDSRYDPFYLNSFFIVEHPGIKKERPHGVTYYGAYLFWVILRHFLSLLVKTKWFRFPSANKLRNKYRGNYLVFGLTNNNRNAVAPLMEELSKNSITFIELTSLMDNTLFPSWKCFFMALSGMSDFWRKFRKEPSEAQSIISHYYMYYLLSYGYYDCFSTLIKDNQLKGVIFSNDHIAANRALEYLCKDYNIPSLYIQHASVSEYYPELNFTYSFLDGMDSFNKYKKDKRVNSIPVIFGALRYEKLKALRRVEIIRHNSIGIAINIIDSEGVVQKLCDYISESLPDYKIVVRAHPNLLKKPFRISGKNIEYTNAVDESIMCFLDRIDVLVSNDSTIHLDAIEYGLSSIKYNLSDEGFTDQYSYIQKGLIKNCTSPEELVSLIKNPELAKSDPSIVRYYDQSYLRNYGVVLNRILAEFIASQFDESILLRYDFEKKKTEEGLIYYAPINS